MTMIAAGNILGKGLKKASGLTNPAAEFLFDQKPMSHRFRVQIDKAVYELGSWSKVAGLSVRWTKLTYRAGESNHEEVFAGNPTNETIKLSRAACSDSAKVKTWLATTSRCRETYSGSVSLLDFLGMPVVEWHFRELFPISWSIGELDSASARPMIETLELAHNGFLDDEAHVNDRR